MSRLSLSALTSGNRISFFILLLPRVTFKTCNLLLAGPCRAELVRTRVNKQNRAGDRKQDHVRRWFLLFLLCGEARAWKSVFSSGFKRSRVKMGCFDVFYISHIFIIWCHCKWANCAIFWHHCCCNKTKKNTRCWFFFYYFKVVVWSECAAGKCPSKTQFFVATSTVRKMSWCLVKNMILCPDVTSQTSSVVASNTALNCPDVWLKISDSLSLTQLENILTPRHKLLISLQQSRLDNIWTCCHKYLVLSQETTWKCPDILLKNINFCCHKHFENVPTSGQQYLETWLEMILMSRQKHQFSLPLTWLEKCPDVLSKIWFCAPTLHRKHPALSPLTRL